MALDWIDFHDLDGARTFAAPFGDERIGGLLLWRPAEPVAFSPDAAAAELAGVPWAWSYVPAFDLDEAEKVGTELAERLASADAYRRAARAGRTGKGERRPDAVTRARAWMRAQPASVARNDGDRQLFAVALGLVRGFGLEPDGAAGVLLEEYDARSEPAWGARKRRAVLVYVEAHGRRPWGYLLDAPPLSRGGRGAGRGRR